MGLFWLWIAHAIGMITEVARLPARPTIYFLGWVATLAMASHQLDYKTRRILR
jgi:hypothetical protein